MKIDSSSIIENDNTGINISSDFDYGSRITVIEHSTITGNNGDGITLREYGQVIVNYNNLYGNGGPEFSNCKQITLMRLMLGLIGGVMRLLPR